MYQGITYEELVSHNTKVQDDILVERVAYLTEMHKSHNMQEVEKFYLDGYITEEEFKQSADIFNLINAELGVCIVEASKRGLLLS